MRISDWSSDVCSSDLHHGLEAAGADILDLAVYLGGDAGDGAHAVVGEVHRDALGGDQRRILLGEARVGLLEDADEVLLGERLQLDTDGKAALEFGEKIARLGDMEGSRRDEEVRSEEHRPVFGGDRGVFGIGSASRWEKGS